MGFDVVDFDLYSHISVSLHGAHGSLASSLRVFCRTFPKHF